MYPHIPLIRFRKHQTLTSLPVNAALLENSQQMDKRNNHGKTVRRTLRFPEVNLPLVTA